MSVEKPDVDKVDDNIVEVGEVEVISDLDLVEVVTLDYKLPEYKPLTYSGQKKLGEELDLKLLNSTNCIRGNIPVGSNLREFKPSKLMKIPGDGNCLFTSLSYWLTGSVDHSSLVRSKIIDNMVGKLKDACNKFIVNKFPKVSLIIEIFQIM